MSEPTIATAGEFALIAGFTADLPARPEVLIGPGDDAAVLSIDGPLATSIDVLVEGVHFRRTWSEPADVGRKAVAVNVADLEAMGARATAIVVGLCAPADLPVSWLDGLVRGLRAECDAAGVSLIGGDLTRGRDVTVAVTVFGVFEGRAPVRRSGARPGDQLALTGRVGWAAAGLAVLTRGFRSPRVVVEAYRVPVVRYGAGAEAADAGATAMIDISDGLLSDLGHVARASAVSVDVHREAFVIPDPLRAVAAATGTDPYALMLTGGEDHALLATFPPGVDLPPEWSPIGVVSEPGPDGPAVTVDGAGWDGTPGWDHFGPTR